MTVNNVLIDRRNGALLGSVIILHKLKAIQRWAIWARQLEDSIQWIYKAITKRDSKVGGELAIAPPIHHAIANQIKKTVTALDFYYSFTCISLKYVEYTIHRVVLGATKELQHVVLEYRGDPVQPGRRSKFDSSQSLVLPALPTTLVGVCRMINVYYALHVSQFEVADWSRPIKSIFGNTHPQVSLLLESEAEDLTMEFPVTIATVPFRIPNSPNQPVVYYGTLHFNYSADAGWNDVQGALKPIHPFVLIMPMFLFYYLCYADRAGVWACGRRSICRAGVPARPSLRRWAQHLWRGRRSLSSRLRLRQLVAKSPENWQQFRGQLC